MSGERVIEGAAVVELLVTWGASAEPATRDLLDALSAFRGREKLTLLRGLLEVPDAVTDPALRRELENLARSYATGSGTGTEARVRRALERLGPTLTTRCGEERKALQEELRTWARLLDRGERDDLLGQLWRGGRAEGVEAELASVRELAEARTSLSATRTRIEDDLRSLLARVEVAPDVADFARGALESGDPSKLRRARALLNESEAREGRRGVERELAASRQRVAELCTQASEIAERSNAGLAAGAGEMLRVTLRAGKAAAGSGAGPDLDDDAATRLRAIEGWSRTLQVMVDNAGETAGNTRSIEEALSEAVERESLEDEASPETAKQLREAAAELSRELESSASKLPTNRVVQARVLVEQVSGAIATGDSAVVAELGGSIREETLEVRRLVSLMRKRRADRHTAARDRLRDEGQRLREAARGGAAKKLAALVPALEGAEPPAVANLERELQTLRRRVGNETRLASAKVLRRAETRRGGSDDDELGRKLSELRSHVEKDDLSAMAKLSAEIAAELPTSWLRGPLGLVALAVLVVVVGAGGFFAWQRMTEGARPYELSLGDAGASTSGLSITLVRDGRIFEQKPYTGGATTFSLPPGRYEVYVNGSFTGRVVSVPADATKITGIPVPAGPAISPSESPE